MRYEGSHRVSPGILLLVTLKVLGEDSAGSEDELLLLKGILGGRVSPVLEGSLSS